MKRNAKRTRTLAAALAVLLALAVLAPVQALADGPYMPGGAVVSILRGIIDGKTFRQPWEFEPLVSVSDQNKDGIWELLAVYECQDGNDYYVSEEVWLIDGETEESKKVGSGVLFHEVGGNSGTMALVERDDQLGVLISTSEPDGTDFFDRYDYFSLAEGELKLGEDYFTMESTGSYGQEYDAECIVDRKDVSFQEFEEVLESMAPCRVLDILAGPDWDDDVLSFNVMLT